MNALQTLTARLVCNLLSISIVAGLSAQGRMEAKTKSITGRDRDVFGVQYSYGTDGVNFQPINSFANLSAGPYTVTVGDSMNCQKSFNEALRNSLAATASADDANCTANNGKITVTATGGVPPITYSLDGVNYQPGNAFNNLIAGNYTVTVKDAIGDTVIVNVTVGSVNNLLISIVTTGQTCVGIDGGIIVSFTGGILPVLYQLNNGPFQPNNNMGSLLAGSYQVNVRDGYGCMASQTVSIPMVDNLSIDAGPDKTICEGSSTTLTASSNGTIFNWTPGVSLSNTSSLNTLAFPSATTKYYIQSTLGICNSIDSVTVVVQPAPIPNAGGDVVTCFGQSVQLNGSGGLTCLWAPPTNLSNTQVNNPYVTNPQTSISYYLKVVGNNGCTSLNNDTVNVLVNPPVAVFAGNDTFVVSGEPLQLNASGPGGDPIASYTWTPAQGLNNPLIQNPVAILTQEITYTVTGYNSGGCSGTDQVKIEIIRDYEIYLPNAFTPDRDGKNDVLRALPRGIKQFHYLTIFNRWGEKVFTTSDPQTGWDGTYMGKEQKAGVFVWMAAGIDYNGKLLERKGTVVLIR